MWTVTKWDFFETQCSTEGSCMCMGQKTGRGYVQCSCQSTLAWQRHRTRRLVLPNTTWLTLALYAAPPCFCHRRRLVAHVGTLLEVYITWQQWQISLRLLLTLVACSRNTNRYIYNQWCRGREAAPSWNLRLSENFFLSKMFFQKVQNLEPPFLWN